MRTSWLWLGFALFAGCADFKPVSPEPRPLRVEWAGCHRVYRGPVCELTVARRLTLWVEHPGPLRITLKTPESFRVTPMEGGQRITLDVPEDATELVVTTPFAHRWTLPLRA